LTFLYLRYCSGARYPDLHTAKKISGVLDVSIDDLLSGEEIQFNIEKMPLLVCQQKRRGLMTK